TGSVPDLPASSSPCSRRREPTRVLVAAIYGLVAAGPSPVAGRFASRCLLFLLLASQVTFTVPVCGDHRRGRTPGGAPASHGSRSLGHTAGSPVRRRCSGCSANGFSAWRGRQKSRREPGIPRRWGSRAWDVDTEC